MRRCGVAHYLTLESRSSSVIVSTVSLPINISGYTCSMRKMIGNGRAMTDL